MRSIVIVIILIGIAAGAAQLPWSTFPWHELWVTLKWGFLIWLAFALSVRIVAHSRYNHDDDIEESTGSWEKTGSWTDDWANIPDATVTPLENEAFRLDARGRSFIIAQNKKGQKAAREIDQHGNYISKPMFSSERDPNGEGLANLLKYKINTRRK